MFPIIPVPIFDINLYTFGLFLIASMVAFIYMLQKMCRKLGINPNFFLGSALAFVLATFLGARGFFVLLEWRDYEFIVRDHVLNFFVMTDYNLSLFWGIIGFMAVLLYRLKSHSQKHEKYIDAVVVAFLFAAIIGYIGAFMGGQIYGRPTSLPIGIIYSENLNIPFTSAVLPLALIYSFGCFIIFSGIYISREFLKISGIVGYLGIALFSLMLLVGEFFSGNDDILGNYLNIGFTQIGAIIGLIIAGTWLSRKIYLQK